MFVYTELILSAGTLTALNPDGSDETLFQWDCQKWRSLNYPYFYSVALCYTCSVTFNAWVKQSTQCSTNNCYLMVLTVQKGSFITFYHVPTTIILVVVIMFNVTLLGLEMLSYSLLKSSHEHLEWMVKALLTIKQSQVLLSQ